MGAASLLALGVKEGTWCALQRLGEALLLVGAGRGGLREGEAFPCPCTGPTASAARGSQPLIAPVVDPLQASRCSNRGGCRPGAATRWQGLWVAVVSGASRWTGGPGAPPARGQLRPAGLLVREHREPVAAAGAEGHWLRLPMKEGGWPWPWPEDRIEGILLVGAAGHQVDLLASLLGTRSRRGPEPDPEPGPGRGEPAGLLPPAGLGAACIVDAITRQG